MMMKVGGVVFSLVGCSLFMTMLDSALSAHPKAAPWKRQERHRGLPPNGNGKRRFPRRRMKSGSGKGGSESSISVSAVATGAQETADVDTDTTGFITLSFDEGFTEAEFEVNLEDAEGITAAHLHCGTAGTDGDILATLFEGTFPESSSSSGSSSSKSSSSSGDSDDTLLTDGALENSDLAGTDCDGITVSTVAALYQAIRNGSVYLNIHSEENTAGEVRAQLFV